jgi:glycogen debranching enzyme
MAQVIIRSDVLYAWRGQSLVIVDRRGEASRAVPLTGYYFREARHLRDLRLTVDGRRPWLCQAAWSEPAVLRFDFVHPELGEFGGGGTGASDDVVTTDERGIPHRALDLLLEYRVGVAELAVSLCVTNRSRRNLAFELGWALDADFTDIQESMAGEPAARAPVTRTCLAAGVSFAHDHPELPYRTCVAAVDGRAWQASAGSLVTHIRLDAQGSVTLRLRVRPHDYIDPVTEEDGTQRGRFLDAWATALARVTTPGNSLIENTLRHNIRDLTSFPLLQGTEDEWLAMQAGMPVYPALFGRDTITAGWQAAFLDRGAALDASLTRVGRMQSDRFDDWRDEEPGRLPYQVRQGPLARLNINPYSAYYADFASPLMFVIALGHLYAWTGERSCIARHWDTARRILDWARTCGDADGDGYLEYRTRSSKGTKNQGWKDSGDAIVYDDGSPVPSPIATCEIQGYWFAAQQLMAVLSRVMGARADAHAFWTSAADLKTRFNRDWWVADERCVALAMDPDKTLVRAVTSNAGHCLATGIVDDAHLPPLVGRLFAPDMFSGWGIRTLSADHAAYNPVGYHLGSVWAVENATIAFGLRRFGFDARALDVTRALFDLAALYPEYRIPETVGGYARGDVPFPGAYPRTNTPQLWNASGFALLVHTILGLQPVAPLDLLVVDPVLPGWLPELIVHDLRVAGAKATIRFWRDDHGASHAEVLHRSGTLRVVKQPPPESLSVGVVDRFRALADRLVHR